MKFGFIDYYLDEWHANNYPEWIKNATGEVPEIIAWAKTDSMKEGGLTTDAWCKKMGARRASSIAEVVNEADCLFLLSPDDPEEHLALAAEIFAQNKDKKPLFIDKTFAPDAEIAAEIIRLGEASGTPFFSSSALRFAPEYRHMAAKCRDTVVSFSTWNFMIELIHPIEMLESMMGIGVKDLMTNGDRDSFVVLFRYEDGRHATLNYALHCKGLGHQVQTFDGETRNVYVSEKSFFQAMTNDMIAFFRDPSTLPVSHEDTLEAMKIRDAILLAMNKPYEWVKIE